MPLNDRWPLEMQMLQEAIVWLVPDEAMARTLVSEAGIPETFIDFGEPVWNRIKRILVESEKRAMIPQLLAVVTKWYGDNPAFIEAKTVWEEGEDRKVAARILRTAAKLIPEPVAVAKITREKDVVKKVDIEVVLPESEPEPQPQPQLPEEEIPQSMYSDVMEPGDWFSAQKTHVDFEQRLRELESWRRQLSIMPTIKPSEETES